MDGTILDSLPDLVRSVNLALAQMGFPERSENEILYYVGNGAERLIYQACPEGATHEQCKETLLLWRKLYSEQVAVLSQPYPGVREAIAQLRDAGMKTAVLSNKFDSAVKLLAERYFDGLFELACGEGPNVPRKPDPTGLLYVCEQLGVTPHETAYVGDTDIDLQTATNAGTRFIGVSWGYSAALPLPVEQLEAYIHQPAELLEFARL